MFTPTSLCRRVMSAVALAAVTAPAVAATYDVGPGQPYATPIEMPWEALVAGDVVNIHWRAEPYRTKFVINAAGSEAAPITVRGIPGPDGALPVIDGENATTRTALSYWNENRSVVKIGAASVPGTETASWIVLEHLDVRGGRPPATFTDDSGNVQTYSDNAAAIHVERGEHITIRGCTIRDSGNGLFVTSSGSIIARDILIEGCFIHGNGIVGSIYQHNTYTAAIGITYQFNRFGALQPGAGGNNLKDRSAGLVVRGNWIEDGNRQLDLVDAEDSSLIAQDPSYARTWVYGNVLVEHDGEGNSQIMHYGGDSGNTGAYRKGRLHLHHNTVVSRRSGNTTLVRLSTNDETCDARNNILYVTASGNRFAMIDGSGTIDLSHNWMKPDWRSTHGSLVGAVNDDGTTIESAAPGFTDEAHDDFRPLAPSPCIDAAGTLHPEALGAHEPDVTWAGMQRGAVRTTAHDVGALESGSRADVDGDGVVGFSDLLAVLGAWGACALPPVACATDVDRDGVVGFGDVVVVLAMWGE